MVIEMSVVPGPAFESLALQFLKLREPVTHSSLNDRVQENAVKFYLAQP